MSLLRVTLYTLNPAFFGKIVLLLLLGYDLCKAGRELPLCKLKKACEGKIGATLAAYYVDRTSNVFIRINQSFLSM